jgi:hypothetical protein
MRNEYSLKERVNSEEIGIEGKIGLEKILKGIGWIHVNEVRVLCQAVVNTVMKLRDP